MKKIIPLIIFLVALGSCKKYLDKRDQLGLVEEDVFSRYEGVRGYLDACYAALLDIHGWESQYLQRASVSALSDEMASNSAANNGIMNIINLGDWLNKRTTGEIGFDRSNGDVGGSRGAVMDNAFMCLRICNKVIEKIETVPGLSAEQKNQLLGQAYFFRGWYYFQIIQRMGGMPIYDKVYNANDDLDVPRKTYAESNEFVIQNMDKAIEFLPHLWPGSEKGRTTKAAAMAVKEMAMLYAASPLMQNDLNSIVNNGYGIAAAEKAAEYANDLIKYCVANTGGTNFRLLSGADYKFIFYHAPNTVSDESIWYNFNGATRDQSRGLRCLYIPQFHSGGTGIDAASFCSPTQNMADKYEVINAGNAYAINDSRSGYNPQKPFLNRDPRFYNNFIVPGEQWGSNSNNTPAYMEMYVGGRDLLNAQNNNNVRNRLTSGYVCKKFIWPGANFVNLEYNRYNLNTIYIRLAQVYLDYAEAMNEAYGPNADPKGYGLTAVAAVNLIRARVGMPPVLAEFTASKELFRDKIRNERTVELMFENHRWHDLRRWMIAEQVLSQPIMGMRATPPANHATIANKSTLVFTYNMAFPLTTEQRVFQLKHYWYPVDQNQVNNQFNFKQNPGW